MGSWPQRQSSSSSEQAHLLQQTTNQQQPKIYQPYNQDRPNSSTPINRRPSYQQQKQNSLQHQQSYATATSSSSSLKSTQSNNQLLVNQSTSYSMASSSGCYAPVAGRSSATPVSQSSSRSGSSLFGSPNQMHQQRKASACSISSQGSNQVTPVNNSTTAAIVSSDNLGRCRICRKCITANEDCHLCSNCNQFICEDCASYSSSDKHWMCSVCRRRATKPAISADTLKELGLNQDSSPVRRMTLRLNQSDLKGLTTNLSKGSSESASSNSSSGCSSMSASHQQQSSGSSTTSSSANGYHQSRLVAQSSKAPVRATESSAQNDPAQQVNRASLLPSQSVRKDSIRFVGENQKSGISAQTGKQSCDSMTPSQSIKQQKDQVSGSSLDRSSASLQLVAGKISDQQSLARGASTITTGIGCGGNQQQRTGSFRSGVGQSSTSGAPQVSSSRMPVRSFQQQQQQQQQHKLNQKPLSAGGSNLTGSNSVRRASVAVTIGNQNNSSSNLISRVRSNNEGQSMIRKQSTAFYTSTAAPTFQQMSFQTSNYMMPQPQTIVTASSDASMNNIHQQDPRVIAQHREQQQLQQRRESLLLDNQVTGGLIPIPPDQIHLRRLSDQSNLFRRSSIIADTIENLTIARNRSHSNIDTVSHANYLYQLPLGDTSAGLSQFAGQNFPIQADAIHLPLDEPLSRFKRQHQSYGYSDDNLNHHNPAAFGNQLDVSGYNSQQRRPSDQWVQQQHVAAQQQSRKQQLQQQQQQQQPQQEPEISSIITPYKQKHRQASEDVHSDSSSDIDEEANRGLPLAAYDQADPSAASAQLYANRSNQQQLQAAQNQQSFQPLDYMHSPMPAVPGISVSEFSGSHSKIRQQQKQQNAQFDERIMSTPMQINSAIEQAILKQQRQQQRSSDFHTHLSSHNFQLQPRRGSSGRVLPKIPGEQSRSLLDLPHDGGGGGGGQANKQMNGLGQEQVGSNQQLVSMLDLPALSPTIRRASAPEGQNIKIVVDDIDCSMKACSGNIAGMVKGMPNMSLYGKQGEFYERVVLYRDDSLDPNTNMARGFGLQVMGGKIDHASSSSMLDRDDAGPRQVSLQACVAWVLPGGPADKVGLRVGDRIIEWDGKCLVNMTYEQVADVIESSANIAELLIKPAQKLNSELTGANYVRSQRRMSQQTEQDLKRFQLMHQQPFLPTSQEQSEGQYGGGYERRASTQMNHWLAHSNQLKQPTSQLVYERQRIEPALSTGNLPSSALSQRTGTGRRLPQIPGIIQNQQNSSSSYQSSANQLNLSDSRQTSVSTGQLIDQQQQHQLYGGAYAPASGYSGNHLNTELHGAEQHARSAGDLYSQMESKSGDNSYNYNHYADTSHGNQVVTHTQSNGGSSHRQQQQYQVSGGGYLSSNNNNSSDMSEICGSIGLQVSVDERAAQLEISVLSAINIYRDLNQRYYVRVKILPESNRFKACTTLPRTDMNWNETLLFQNFPIQQMQKMALEIGVWLYDETARLSTQIPQPICETLVSIQSARERNTDFWPLRRPICSPQARRKSLNDLLDSEMSRADGAASSSWFNNQQANFGLGGQLSAGHQTSDRQMYKHFPTAGVEQQTAFHQTTNYRYEYDNDSPTINVIQRERSSSNRNLPDANKLLKAQPRRASDEVAGSNGYRLAARLSPAQSRRSISVLNVQNNEPPCSQHSRASSRRGSQMSVASKIQQARRDSGQQLKSTASSNSAASNKFASPTPSISGAPSRSSEQSGVVVGLTPSGRRSSLVGIQSMTAYRSQKNSNSDTATTTDQGSPLKGSLTSASGLKRSQPGTPRQSNLMLGSPTVMQTQHRASLASASSSPSHKMSVEGLESGNNSRRGSSTVDPNTGLQRKGSFAIMTLRKLKRTMSLTKGNDQDQTGSGRGSRRSSEESTSSLEIGEDEGVTRRIMAHKDFVGKLKLSFILTMGSLEVDVISAQGLKYDKSTALGIYVKVYLKGKSRTNKRKTRLIQPWESPVFKQLIKYDGSLVDNKSLEVSVWQKQGGLKGKVPIGFTEIRLSELNLSRIQISWYNLRSMDALGGSSIDDM